MSPIFMLLDGKTGAILYANSEAWKFYGPSKEDFFRLTVFDLDTRDDALLRRELADALAGKAGSVETMHTAAGGELKKVEMVFDKAASGKNAEAGSIYVNVRPLPSDHELTVQRMQNILDSLPDTILEIDPSMKVVWANKKARLKIPDIFDKYCYAVFHNKEQPCPNCPAHRALQTGNIEKGNIYFSEAGKSGKELYLANIGVPIKDRENNTVGVLEITRDITDQYTTKEELERSNRELRNLSMHLQSVQEEERKKIARDIHDDFGQAMTAIKMYAYWIHKHLSSADGQLKKKAEEMLDLIDTTAKSIQRTVAELRTGYHDELDFRSALEWEIENFAETTGIRTDYSLEGLTKLPNRRNSRILYRVLQESLTNISRHAEASRISVEVETDDTKIYMKIEDNGIGISEEQLYSSTAFGIIGMRERCNSAGGTLHISGKVHEGTRVHAELPLS